MSPSSGKAKLSKRAYTIALTGPADNSSWKDHLWTTHRKVSEGTQFFGDFLLTLRGGLSGTKNQLNQKQRRLLALCWFSVESQRPETKKYVIPRKQPQESCADDVNKMVAALRKCLVVKGIIRREEIDSWVDDCKDALLARIRDDSVWVQRWKMFEDLAEKPGPKEIEEILKRILGKGFFSVGKSEEDEGEEFVAKLSEADEKKVGQARNAGRQLICDWFGKGKKSDSSKLKSAYDRLMVFAVSMRESPPRDAKELKDCIQEFRKQKKWKEVTPKFKGKGADKQLVSVPEPELVCSGPGKAVRTEWNRALLAVRAHDKFEPPDEDLSRKFLEPEIWETIEKSAKDKIKAISPKANSLGNSTDWSTPLLGRLKEAVGINEFADNSGDKANTPYFYLMLGTAAGLLSKTHSWVCRAEISRTDAKLRAENKESKFSAGGEYDGASRWLEDYLDRRSRQTNAGAAMRIRKEALGCWEEVIKRWKDLTSENERKQAVKEIQEWTEEKFGDVNLFFDLAADDAKCVWQKNGKTDASILNDYVNWTEALFKAQSYKVPSYRHPDPYEHPVFCEFGNSKPDVKYVWQSEPDLTDPRKIGAIQLVLLDGEGQARTTKLHWRSKRLREEFGFSEEEAEKWDALPRNTRLGRAAIGIFPEGKMNPRMPALPFDGKKQWNARLQTSRENLARLGRLDESKRAKNLRDLRWFVTFSPELKCTGPGLDFLETPEIQKIIVGKDSPLWYIKKEKCLDFRRDVGWMVRPGLGVFPGIRVMGVDLGHRYGAACAVWQQVSSDSVAEAARAAGVQPPELQAISFRCEKVPREERERWHVFRRLSSTHWAKLERQFVIKLPGEIEPARSLFDWERKWFEGFVKELGREWDDSTGYAQCYKDVVRARLEALHLASRALARNGDRARIAHDLISEELPETGGKMRPIQTSAQRVWYVRKALLLWDALVHRGGWKRDFERELWAKDIVSLHDVLKELANVEDDENLPKEVQRAREQHYDQVAKKLVANGNILQAIAKGFFKEWEEEDKQWPGRLKSLSSWIAEGRKIDAAIGKWKKTNIKEIRDVGGLSLDRIATLEQLARLQRAFTQRPTRERLWNESKEGERPGRRIRDKMERLRDDRLKKLANAIAMAAMGLVGKEGSRTNDKIAKIEQERHEGPRFAPVHAVVIEDLEHYRPEATRTRRENRGLMSWSAGQLKKRLGESCELYGFLFLQVRPNYTSRFCSRCGAGGVRCEDVQLNSFGTDRYWSRQVSKAKKPLEQDRDELQKWLVELRQEDLDQGGWVRLPRDGGLFFVCSNKNCPVSGQIDPKSPKIGGLQADINAAANIGLRGMVDGRWAGAWSYIPTKDNSPDKNSKALKKMPEELERVSFYSNGAGSKNTKQSKEPKTFNSFRDVSMGMAANGSVWKPYKEFFNEARKQVTGFMKAQHDNYKNRSGFAATSLTALPIK